MSLLLKAILIGILATITMDILSIALGRLGLVAPLPPRLMGRWFALVARGRPLQADIAKALPVKREMAIAVPTHYAIGITLALIFLLASAAFGLNPRNFLVALRFALCTNIFPWLLMFPAMGYGWFGLHGPPNTRLFRSSFVSHTFYGLGLWLGSSLVFR